MNLSKKQNRAIIIGSVILVVLLVVVFRVSDTYVKSVINMLLYNIVIVLGLNFITGLTGQMNLATAGMLAMGAYTYAILTTKVGWNPWIALIALIAVGLALGRALGYPSLRLKGFFLSLTTIGFSEVVRLLASNLPDLTGGTMGLSNIPGLPFLFKIVDKNDYFYINIVFMIIMVLIAVRIVYSKWGRAYKAVRDNAEAAEADGINISKLKIQAFTLASIYSVVAGCMYAGYNTYLNPSGFTITYSQNYVAMLMIGGMGSVPGNIIGAFLVTVLPEALRQFQNYYWLVFCSIMLLIAILMPDGLWPQFKKIIKKIKKRKKTPEKPKEVI